MSNTMSVSSLNTKIKSLLEATFMHSLVEGEVASATYHTSGHLYFSIKDDKSALKCVMWRSSVARMKFRIEKGMQIIVDGSVSVYAPRGEYQFQTVRIEPAGQGALALAFEQLKKKLKEKGYFSAEHKKVLPKIPKRLALVTAKESAALHDMLKIIEKRWQFLEVFIVDTLVQGENASTQIARSLAYADSLGVDIVVVGRGGGSVEDLWAFNEEVVADALYNMKTPVVSAVGHEVDTLMSDYVADLRAPTPSAAMEMILPDMNELLYTLDDNEERYKQIINGILYDKAQKINHQNQMLKRLSPMLSIEQFKGAFDDIATQFSKVMTYTLENLSLKPFKLKEQMHQNVHFLFKQKLQNIEYVKSALKLNNPAHKSKEGWGEIVVNSKRVALKNLQKDDIFIVQDAEVKVEANVITKRKL